MLDFQLFRIKVFPPAQSHLFEGDKTPQEILVETIRSLPETRSKRGLVWHIGNVTGLDESSLYFRVGRTSRSTVEVYHEGRFIDEQFETSPYTHVILDTRLEVCAIARKAKLSKTTNGISRQLARLLNRSEHARQIRGRFEVSMISNPESFIRQLREAASVERFWLTFTRPNAFDADEDFVKPTERLLAAADGNRGKTQIKGARMDVGVLEQLTRSVAATGDNAGASIRQEENEPTIPVSLRGDAVDLAQESVDTDEEKLTLLQKLRERYESIREGLSGK